MLRSVLLPALACLGLQAGPRDGAPPREPVDILITRGTIITMDPTRRVLEDGAVAIRADRIVAVGTTRDLTARFEPRETIDAYRKVVMPGLIDGHGHAGHGLVKSLGMDTDEWYPATEKIYAGGSTVDFWRAEALLTGVERVRFGVTTALSYFGGGDMVVRTDDPKYGDAYLGAIDTVGIRFILAVGPRRPPFPRTFVEWSGDSSRAVPVTFARQMEVSEALIRKWNGAGDGRLHLAVMFPTQNPATNPLAGAALEEIKAQARAARDLSKRYGILFTQDGHARGTVKYADEVLHLLGPDVLLSHATGMTDEEIAIVARTGTKIVHNPSAVAAQREQFRLVELLDAGATVMLGSDGVAPDRSYDMFRHMFQAMRYHRFAWRDASVLPAGKVLEMVTIDAARALGMEKEIGSLEPGKKADLILVDLFRPHMVPMNMPLYRIAYFANGNDVSTVLVNGRVLMRDRRVLSVNEEEVLTYADREAEAAIRRSGLERLKETPEGFWGRSRMPKPATPPAAPPAAPPTASLPFAPVQRELFAVPNSFANAWGDYDNDGDLDLAVSTASGEVRLYRNDRGVMVSVGAPMGMPQAGSHELRGLSWGDFDADGFLDLLGGATAKDKLTLVLHNERGRHFTDVAARIGLTIPNRSARQTSWVDYDNDGDLDVYATDRAGENRLFRNDGGTYAQVFAGVGPSDSRPTVGACWFDFDRDGDLDVFLANQSGAADALWRNDGERFTDVAPALGMTGPPRTTDKGGVGCAVGDYDNDGDFDLFVANYGHNQLYRNDGDGTFTEVAQTLGVGIENHAVSADWGDYDNDGDLDLWISSYEGASGAQAPHDALFRNDGAAGFVNLLASDSPLHVADHGVQWVDFDNDGGLDLSVTDGYGPVGGHFLFRSTLPDAAKRRSLHVLVLDAKGHQTRFGAEVRLADRSGRIFASRLVAAGGGYDTQSAAPVHFGLATLDPVTVQVTFMGKDGRKTQTVRNVRPSEYLGKSLVIRQAR